VEIYRDTDSNPSGRVRVAYVSGLSSYTDTTVSNGTTYWYWIKNTVNGVVSGSDGISVTPNGSAGSSSSKSSSSSSAASGATMKISGSKLYDANGKEFIMRGLNLQYGDYPAERIQSINPIASTGTNTIRLELRSNTTASELAAALDAIVAKKMVAMVMYWESDVTCTGGTSGFNTAMSRWTSTWKSVLSDSKYQKYLLLNIANEWGGKGTAYSVYEDSYVSAIKQLRSVGYKFPIVIDAPDCGQNYSQLASSASKFKAADSLGNTMLSLHAYWSYQNSSKISAAMTALNSTGMPWVWGEFPSNQFQASIGQNTDHVSLMKLANSNGVGYLAWSWRGNGSGEEQKLDMSNSYTSSSSLTWWGQEVIEGASSGSVPGIRATSKLVTY
jgi:mannan endo-1,4-beta-mannosidase